MNEKIKKNWNNISDILFVPWVFVVRFYFNNNFQNEWISKKWMKKINKLKLI